MKSKKPSQNRKPDTGWQKKIEKKVQVEKLNIGHPKGQERFENAIKQVYGKSKSID